MIVFVLNLIVETSFLKTDGRGDWSKEGCNINSMNDKLDDQDVVICQCSHLSTLGVFVVSFGNPILLNL